MIKTFCSAQKCVTDLSGFLHNKITDDFKRMNQMIHSLRVMCDGNGGSYFPHFSPRGQTLFCALVSQPSWSFSMIPFPWFISIQHQCWTGCFSMFLPKNDQSRKSCPRTRWDHWWDDSRWSSVIWASPRLTSNIKSFLGRKFKNAPIIQLLAFCLSFNVICIEYHSS